MGNMLRATVTIEGTRPLFFHKFGRDAIPLEKQERTGVAGNDPETWRKTTDVTQNGQLRVDGSYAFATIRNGGRFTKKGTRGTLQGPIEATLQIEDDRILVDRYFPGFPNGHAFDIKTAEVPSEEPEEPIYLDVRGTVQPKTRARNVTYRIVASPGWHMTFHLLWDKTIVSRAEMEAVLIDAGKLVGIGNARKIGMGRFNITQFDVEEA